VLSKKMLSVVVVLFLLGVVPGAVLADSVVVFNEIMYRPADNGASQEWIELYNQMSVDVDLTGWSLRDGINYDFPAGTIIPAGAYLVIGSSPVEFLDATGQAHVLGSFVGRLSDGGEKICLYDHNQRMMDNLAYDDEMPWPVACAGSGVSLAKYDKFSAGEFAANWRASQQVGGTPGAVNFPTSVSGVVIEGPRLRQVLTNPQFTPVSLHSVAFHEVTPVSSESFWVELFNHGDKTINLAGFVIRSSAGEEVSLPSLLLEAGQFYVAEGLALGLAVNNGDRFFLFTPDQKSVIDAVILTERLQGRTAEDPTGPMQYPYLPTPGQPNLFLFHDEIVINEIMYHYRPDYATPGTPPTYEENRLIPLDATWTYDVSGNDLGPIWMETGYDDSSWLSGQGVLGYEQSALPEPIRTPLASNGQITYYFRTAFDFGGPLDGAQLSLRTLIDDGVVVYLNGTEVYRQNMPSGLIGPATRASAGVSNASFAGPVSIGPDRLLIGKNILAVEVHQTSVSSSDMVFGLELVTRELVEPGTQGTPFAENPEEWIELYNRSDYAVDLSGWQLDQAVRYTFGLNTVLGANEYLVVAKDVAVLQEKWPDVRIVGDYSGKLSNRHEQIRLLDNHGNITDDVHYFDGVPWPQFGDGGGSSLELRNPDMDNAKAEAWAASWEADRSQWHHYSYTGQARAPAYDPPIHFHEFVMGLLDEGEAFLDNVRVKENPLTNPTELIQNSTFENDTSGNLPHAWRIQGTHDRSVVFEDPDHAGNLLLHLIADGPKNYLSNHAETTLAQDRTVVNGRTYEISFDAKWITGSPLLRTELYYNDVPHTAILDIPLLSGTPGRQNTCYESLVGPTFSEFSHAPLIPSSADDVVVSVKVDDPNDVFMVMLVYAVDGLWLPVTMQQAPNGFYQASIPAHPKGTVVQFYVEAWDSQFNISKYPASGTASRALYQVDAFTPNSLRQDLRLIMTSADAKCLFLNTNILSNNRLGATVVYNGDKVFYDVGLRLRGSMFSRTNSSGLGYNIRFHPDDLFRGVHDTITLRTRSKKEILAKHMINRAGGRVPGMYDDLVTLKTPRGYSAGVAMLSMARYGDVFLKSQYDNGTEGTVFKMEGIRVMQTTLSGDPQDLKIYMPIGWVSSFDITDLGDDKERYRWPFKINRNRDKDDYDRLIQMAKSFALNGLALQKALDEVLDVDEWMRQFALMSLCGIGDIYSQGNPHNLNFYVRPSDHKILAMPWDWDFTFNRSTSSSLWGNKNMAKIISLPVYTRTYYWHLYDLMETIYNPQAMSYWINHYGDIAGENFSSYLSYIGSRADYVSNRLPESIGFEVTTNNGSDFSIDSNRAQIEGTAWIDVRHIQLEGRVESLPVIWLDPTTWQVSVPVDPGENVLVFMGYDREQNLIATDEITVISAKSGAWQRPLE